MKMKILTISVFSILLLSSMIFSNYKHGNRSVYINVNSIVNDSLTLITKDSVFNFLKKKNVIKDSMLTLDVDLNKIENELKNIDYLKMSNAFYGINSPLVIQISERNPVIEIKNENFYLDNEGIIISKSGSSPINGETIKSSSGAIFNIPIFKVDHIKDAIFLLKANEIKIVSADEKGENSIYDYKFDRKTSIIMGSEGKGISKSILSLSDNILKIPMKGKVESLNVSVATGIFISELAKQL